MNDLERSSLQEHKEFYELEWQRVQQLRLAEREQRLRAESERDQLKQILKNQESAVQQATLVPQLEQEIKQLEHKLQGLTARFKELESLDNLKNELQESKLRLEQIQKRVGRQDFWQELAREFSEEVDDFPSIKGHGETVDDQLLHSLTQWHREIENTVLQALTNQGRLEQTIRTKRILMAQWALLRWLEITEVVE